MAAAVSRERITMEVCCYNLESAVNAKAAGADRIELCANRYQGGTTPSYGMLEVVRKNVDLPIFAMIRPRGGDFLYSKEELEVMLHDIQMTKELGMEGVVMGVLSKDGQVDSEIMKKLIETARPMEVTFHRAFDLTPDPTKSLEDLISIGVDRVLTSGQQNSAFDGVVLIKSLVETAREAISVMPGAGINEDNVASILEQTGARELHISASGSRPSKMKFHKEQVQMGNDGSEYSIDIADGKRIMRFREIVDQL